MSPNVRNVRDHIHTLFLNAVQTIDENYLMVQVFDVVNNISRRNHYEIVDHDSWHRCLIQQIELSIEISRKHTSTELL